MLKKIEKGSKIGIIAPAFQPDPEKLKNGIDYLKQAGYKIAPGQSLNAKYGYLAGTDAIRLNDIHKMFSDPEISAILCARGGWGCLRLIDQLDYNLIADNPKVIIGYSDITTLQLAIWKKLRIPSISGPMAAVDLNTKMDAFTEQHFWGQINNAGSKYIFNFDSAEVEKWKPGKTEGILLGGCLSMVAHLLGTPFSPDYRGSILFLEDVGEEPYRIDRYMAQLKQAGIFSQIKGLILGSFISCTSPGSGQNSFTVKEVLEQYCTNLKYPVIF
ncbi:MAG: LD-carboxypeptidase, partial [Calditrichaceae bacterium]